jgi:hypothetical protein
LSAGLEPTDADAAELLAKLLGDPQPRRLSIVVKSDDTDVSGHAMDATLDVTISAADDVQGHAFTLRFPNAEAAQRLRLKLAAGVLVAATLTIGGAAVATELGPAPAQEPDAVRERSWAAVRCLARSSGIRPSRSPRTLPLARAPLSW